MEEPPRRAILSSIWLHSTETPQTGTSEQAANKQPTSSQQAANKFPTTSVLFNVGIVKILSCNSLYVE
jgi:hypothetical protein